MYQGIKGRLLDKSILSYPGGSYNSDLQPMKKPLAETERFDVAGNSASASKPTPVGIYSVRNS